MEHDVTATWNMGVFPEGASLRDVASQFAAGFFRRAPFEIAAARYF
jgi:hypothetical protein